MKNLKKMHLCELKKVMPVLDTALQSAIVGGDRYYFNTSGICYNIVDNEEPDEVIVDGVQSGFVLTSGSLKTSGVIGSDGRSGLCIEGGNKNLFKFLAQSTDVEWGMSYNDSGDNPDGIINTNYDMSSIDFLPHEGYDSYVHSHPQGSQSPSGYDQDIKEAYTGDGRYAPKYDYKNFNIYGVDERGNEFEKPIY